MEIGDFFAQVKVRLFLYDMRITTQISQNPNRIVLYICSMTEITDFFAQVKVRLFLYDMRITTQISQNPNRVVRYICVMLEIGDFLRGNRGLFARQCTALFVVLRNLTREPLCTVRATVLSSEGISNNTLTIAGCILSYLSG